MKKKRKEGKKGRKERKKRIKPFIMKSIIIAKR
jgi:hypothetical protein